MSKPGKGHASRNGLTSRAQRVWDFLRRDQWAIELAGMPTFRALAVKASRVLFLAARGFMVDRCSARASALTYITILSLVPMLAFAFSVAKGLGAYDTLEQRVIQPFLENLDRVEVPVEDKEDVRILEEGTDAEQEGTDAEGEQRTDAEGGQRTDAEGEQDVDAQESGAATQAEAEDELPDAEQPGIIAPGDQEPTASGARIREAIEKVLDFVERTDVANLGIFGLMILIFTVIKLLGSIEQAFNDIWGIPRPRSILRKFSDYLSITIIVPLLLVLATGVNAAAKGSEALLFLREELHLGPLFQLALKLSSLVVMWMGFTFMYLFLPNTRVGWKAALIGGIAGGTLWHGAQILHVSFQVGMVKYNAIYSGFAALPIFMIWIYVSWLTVLLGAELAYAYSSESTYRQMLRDRALDHAARERLALRGAVAAARAFMTGNEAPSVHELADQLGVPERALDGVLRTLAERGLLAIIQEEDGWHRVLPGKDLGLIRVEEVLDALKGEGAGLLAPSEEAVDTVVADVFEQRATMLHGAAHDFNLRELARTVLETEARRALDAGEPTGQPARERLSPGTG